MIRTKLTFVALVVAAALFGLGVHGALAAHDTWYAYATSLTGAQESGTDPWYGYAVSLTDAQRSAPFITDTLAPGGTAPVQSYRFVTDTLATGGAPAQSYRFVTDTLAPGGGSSEVRAPAFSGFDWGDAGVGAGVMAAIGVMLLGGLHLLHRRSMLAA